MARAWTTLLAIPAAAAGAITLGMILLVTASVLLRTVTGAEIPGAVELTEIGLYLSAVLAAPWLLNQGQHIRADLLASALPRPAARLLEMACDMLGLVVCAILALYAWRVAAESAALGSLIRRTVTYPEWWLAAPLPAVFGLLALEFAARIARLLANPEAGARDEARSIA
ncbi:TRAP transporter small permease [Roseomonas sp. CCTCC AB2023176]|uniref:TRAP transporter small permease n=1 Tax=Roseomonas sp. CCTCC AB2023176 TaxID=3342640 RepID=UPI0035DD82AD